MARYCLEPALFILSDSRMYYRVKGNRHYELTNHLGNVLAVVTDRKMAKVLNRYSCLSESRQIFFGASQFFEFDAFASGKKNGEAPEEIWPMQPSDECLFKTSNTTTDATYTPQFFMPDVYSVQNYYAFGQSMPNWSSTAAVNDPKKYRFGMNGQERDTEFPGGNTFAAEFWEYDARTARRWNMDPVLSPNESRYASFRGNPVSFNDPNGDCPDCRDGKYEIKKGDTFSGLEKKWGMKEGTLAGYNSGLDPTKLAIGSTIIVSPNSTLTSDSRTQNVSLNAGVSSTSASSIPFDEDFPYDPSAQATSGDYASWAWWGLKANVAGGVTDMDDGVDAYMHYRNGGGADKTFSFDEYRNEDSSGAETLNNVKSILETKLPTILPYAGVRDFHITPVSAGNSSNLFKYPATENWQKAIGAYTFWVTGVVTATEVKGARNYSVTYTLHGVDRYNFNRGMTDIATGTSDNVNGRFSTLGWAHSYLHQTTFSGSLNFTISNIT